jgi:peptidyl-prolyl cis-trans isomerase A (cyclophilin A)
MNTSRLLLLLVTTAMCLLLVVAGVAKAESPFTVRFAVSNLDGESPSDIHEFLVEVHPEWAPLGAAHFKQLIEEGYYTDLRFFRVIKNFMCQFGMHGDPQINRQYGNKKIQDDPVIQSNVRGYLTYATSGKNSRTTQLFFNFGRNSYLDKSGFAPFAVVLGDGMNVIDKIYNGYGEGAPSGKGPGQGAIAHRGNELLDSDFPLLSRIVTVEIVKEEDSSLGDGSIVEDLTKLALRRAIKH